jgi:hypothetical protein
VSRGQAIGTPLPIHAPGNSGICGHRSLNVWEWHHARRVVLDYLLMAHRSRNWACARSFPKKKKLCKSRLVNLFGSTRRPNKLSPQIPARCWCDTTVCYVTDLGSLNSETIHFRTYYHINTFYYVNNGISFLKICHLFLKPSTRERESVCVRVRACVCACVGRGWRECYEACRNT